MPKSARRPSKAAAKKPAAKKPATKNPDAKKPAVKKPAAKKPSPKSSAKRATKALAAFAPETDPDALAERLARATGLATEALLDRALRAFAVAHGVAIEQAPAAEAAPLPPPALKVAPADPVAPAAPLPPAAPIAPVVPVAAPDETPSLSTGNRLYVHGIGRPPIEMIRDTFFIGSSPKGDLWVNAPGIDTRHLRIDRVDGKYIATDMNTEKGTVLHGERLTGPVEVKHEDSFYLGGYHRVRMYVIDGP